MKVLATLSVLLLTVTGTAAAQAGSTDELRHDLVTIQDGKMVIEQYSLDRIELPGYEPVEFQVKFYSEAPARGVISRDHFVAYSTAFELLVLQQTMAQGFGVSAAEFLAAYDSKDLAAPIGRPDLEISIFMTAEGYQLEIRNTETNQVSRSTQTWDSVVGPDK